jgi:hypothetical protein
VETVLHIARFKLGAVDLGLRALLAVACATLVLALLVSMAIALVLVASRLCTGLVGLFESSPRVSNDLKKEGRQEQLLRSSDVTARII